MRKAILATVMLASASGMAFPIGARTGMWNGDEAFLPFQGLIFTAAESGSTVCLKAATGDAMPPALTMEVSFDLGTNWVSYAVDDVITLTNMGDRVCFCAGVGGNRSLGGAYSGESGYNHFVFGGKVYASGNVNSLLTRDYKLKTSLAGSSMSFFRLFYNCTGLLSCPDLPATTLCASCYAEMFRGCESIRQPPELPARVITPACYNSMFMDCKSLERSPELPAEVLESKCYEYMFVRCVSMQEAGKIRAKTIALDSPARCCHGMFGTCSGLTSISIAYPGSLSAAPNRMFEIWVQGVAPTGTLYYSGPDTTHGVSAIPEGWTVEPYVP